MFAEFELRVLGLLFPAGPAEDCEERAGTVHSKHAHSD